MDEKNTPIHLAAYFGCIPKTLEFLLSIYPTCVNKFNNDDRLPIMIAATKGFSKLVQILFHQFFQTLFQKYYLDLMCFDCDCSELLSETWNFIFADCENGTYRKCAISI